MRTPLLITAAIALVLTTITVNADRGNFGPIVHQSIFLTSSRTCGVDSFWNSNKLGPVEIADDFVKRLLTDSDYYVQSSYTDKHSGVTHVYLRQLVGDLEVVNGDINVNIDSKGRVISFGDSFYKGKRTSVEAALETNREFNQMIDQEIQTEIAKIVDEALDVTKDSLKQFVFGSRTSLRKRVLSPELDDYEFRSYSTPKLSPIEALQAFVATQSIPFDCHDKLQITETASLRNGPPVYTITGAPFALSAIPVVEKYLQTETGDLEPVWDLEIEMKDNWFHVQVGAYTGEVLARMDWVADATYNVFKFGQNDPLDGPAQLVEDPSDIIASPKGWHVQGRKNFTTTVGNNVFAQENTDGGQEWEENYRPDGGKEHNFDFFVDPPEQEPKEYLDAAVVNLFYWNNVIHDLFYRYGFDEKSGNFQEHNPVGVGKGRDSVIANAQDGSGYNNANFATPPDGQHGKMRMYVWDQTRPMRDGDLESGIIVHEYAHGISTRLTGGPANSGCLGWGESGGMGEGWGDFFATIFRMKPDMNRTVDFPMGSWANGGNGIRRYKYSTSTKTNPETYKYLDKAGYWGVHAQGATWAEMLYEVYWNMVDKHGFTPDYMPPLPEDHETLSKDKIEEHAREHIMKYGNTLILQLVIDGLKLQPCRPSFVSARDAILQADDILTNGENTCEIWAGFAKRGLGMGAKLVGGTPWGGGVRTESVRVPRRCRGATDPDEPEEPEDPEDPEDFDY